MEGKKKVVHFDEVKGMISNSIGNEEIAMRMKNKHNVIFTNEQLRQIRKRFKKNDGKIIKKGKRPIFSDVRVEEIKADFEKEHDLQAKNLPTQQCREKLQSYPQDRQTNQLAKNRLSRSSQFRYQQKILPMKVESVQVKNDERVKALNDIYSAISMVVMSHHLHGQKLEIPTEQIEAIMAAGAVEDQNEIVEGQQTFLSDSSSSFTSFPTTSVSDSSSSSEGRIKPSNLWNFDATSSFVSTSPAKHAIRMTEKGRKALQERNISPSISVPQSKPRAVKQIYLTSPIGVMPGMIVLIKDRNIKALQFQQITDGFKDNGFQVWLALLPATAVKEKKKQNSAADATSSIALNVNFEVTPAAIPIESDDEENEDTNDHEVNDDCNQDDEEEAEEDWEIEDINVGTELMVRIFREVLVPLVKSRRIVQTDSICVSFDGDKPQIDATMDFITKENEPHNIEFFKFPGGTSMLFQPNDQMRSHSIIHRFIKSYDFSQDPSSIPWYLGMVDSILIANRIQASSRRSFLQFFKHIPSLVSNAFTHKTITDGWKRSGLYPLSGFRMLEQCPLWETLPTDTAANIVKACQTLIDQMEEDSGDLSDVQIEAVLGDNFEYRAREIKDWLVNHCRALWLNKHSVIEKRKGEIQERKRKATEQEEAAQRKRQKQLNKRISEVVEEEVDRYPFLSVPHLPAFGTVHCASQNCNVERKLLEPGKNDGWIRCPMLGKCEAFFCVKTNCQKVAAKAHRNHCMEHRLKENNRSSIN